MNEDIDIEEHDILENPKIKRIFPDLSVLKQEHIDFEVVPEVETKQIDKIKKCNENISGISELSRRKNIICSTSHKLTKNIKKKVKVILQNIGPYLIRTNRFCELCLILFPNKSSRDDHKLNSHPTLVCTAQNIPISSKSNDLQTGDKTNFYESCFHCHMQFQTQRDLIDHLYHTLHAKKAQVTVESITNENHPTNARPIIQNDEILQSTANVKENLERDKVGEVGESFNIYSCPICSYYFSNEKFYRSHVMVKHKAFKSFESMQIHKVAFNPLCKFCHVKYFDLLSYNTHLRKSHKIEMLRQVNNVIPTNNLCGKNYLQNKVSLMTLKKGTCTNKNSKYVQLSTQLSKNYENIADYANVAVEVSKIILFDCSKCRLHFLTYKDAIKHSEHLEVNNWECKNCHKFYKYSDANTHQKQHNLSNYFSIINVNPEIQPKILYKCPKCAVHFYKENVFEHCRICESDKPKSSYCKVCDILIDLDITKSHEDDHLVRNFISSDFKIIELVNPIAQHENKNYKKRCDVSQQHKATIESLNSKVINLANLSLSNTVNKLKKIKTKHFSVFNAENRSIRLNYCRLCKCYLLKSSKSDIHLKSYCVNIAKYLCQYCGLTFSNKSKRHHRRLHLKYSKLKLQDFLFFNLHTNKLMKPSLPQFPNCSSCKRHFTSKIELKDHLCDKNNKSICSICGLTFSLTAYKLHMPFHYYSSKHEKTNEKNLKIKSHDVNEKDKIDPYENKLVTDEVILTTYTCKNCNLSVNMYDEVVEHCHLHENLNKIEGNHVECTTCRLTFTTSSYKKHIELHHNCKNKKIIQFFFDVLYFGCSNKEWLKHIYKSTSENVVDKLLKDSIYKYETRIIMKVVQQGPSCLTVYKCDKCQCIIDCNSTYNHIASCCPNSKISPCSFCELSFACSVTRNSHEKIHSTSDINITSYKIVLFNFQSQNSYYNLSNLKDCYVVYECRNCHVLVQKYNYDRHKCHLDDCKKCSYCGLLIFVSDLDEHISKHKNVPSFNENKIKVVLLGKKENTNNFETIDNLVPTFNGIVCDYTFYKCINCEVCVRDVRHSNQHSCLIDAAKSKCPKCDLIFDEGKLKGHMKFHDEDPDFNKETILVEYFGKRISKKNNTEPELSLMKNKEQNKVEEIVSCSNTITNRKTNRYRTKETIKQITANLYKCTCGLHYMQFSSLKAHKTKCSGKIKNKQSIQSCSKCGLMFTPEVLFKHLLEHHGDKNVEFKYEISF